MNTWIRTASLALSAALALAVAGCGSNNTCVDATPPVSAVPGACSAQSGAAVTVPVHVCPKCDQSMPTCVVHPENGGQILVEPVSQVCDPNSSCPIVDPASCPFATLNCQLTAPPAGSYTILVNTPENPDTIPFTVTSAGGSPPPVTCPL